MSFERATLMSWGDSNMAGDEWMWRVFVTRRADGSYSIGAWQTSDGEGGGYRVRGSYRLRTGEQILSAIEDVFLDDMLQDEAPHWATIVRNAMRFDPKLGAMLQRALRVRADALAEEAIEAARED